MTAYTTEQGLKRSIQGQVEDMLHNGGGRGAFVTSVTIQGDKAIVRGAFNKHISYVITVDDVSSFRKRIENYLDQMSITVVT